MVALLVVSIGGRADGEAYGGAALDQAKAAFRLPALTQARTATETDPVWRLGRSLFAETMLSASGHISCATCHALDRAWADNLARSLGDAGRPLGIRTPTLFGFATANRLGWSGRFRDTAAVIRFAITSPGNMALPLSEAVARLNRAPGYVASFQDAFAGRADEATLLRALQVFVRSIEPAAAPFDRWIDGDEAAITPNAERGFVLFTGKGRCAACHSGPAFTDNSFHDIGVNVADVGRGAAFKTSLMLQHAFKTPSLRGVAERAPYMHDGGRATLEEVVDLYDRGGIERASRADEIRPLHLTADEKADLVAFLRSLSGPTRFATR